MKILMRISAMALACIMMLSFASCASGGTAMKLGGEKMSEQMYAYLMSCYRPYWLNMFGRDDDDEFWNGEADGVTVKEYLQAVTETAIKSKLAAAYLFDEYGLTLSAEKEKEVQSLISGLLLGVGGEEALEEDEVMQQLGMDIDDMEDIFILNAKAEALQDYLYGENGTDKVTQEETDNYYNKNYYRYNHLYIMDVDFVRDEDGEIVFDEDGVAKWEEIDDERWDEKFEGAKELLQRAKDGEDFDKLIEEYSEEIGKEKYPYGHYVNASAATEDTYFPDILDNVKLLEVGGVTLFRSDYGLHLIKRLELDEKGYEHEENEDDFADMQELIIDEKYKERLSAEFSKIKIDQKIIDKYPINEVVYSNSWTYVF